MTFETPIKVDARSGVARGGGARAPYISSALLLPQAPPRKKNCDSAKEKKTKKKREKRGKCVLV